MANTTYPESDPKGFMDAHAFLSNGYVFPSKRRNFFDPEGAKRFFDHHFPQTSVAEQRTAIRATQARLGAKVDGTFGKDSLTAMMLVELGKASLAANGQLGKDGKYGDAGIIVRTLLEAKSPQQDLAAMVKQFQQGRGISPTGIIDKKTVDAFYDMLKSVFADPAKVMAERQAMPTPREAQPAGAEEDRPGLIERTFDQVTGYVGRLIGGKTERGPLQQQYADGKIASQDGSALPPVTNGGHVRVLPAAASTETASRQTPPAHDIWPSA